MFNYVLTSVHCYVLAELYELYEYLVPKCSPYKQCKNSAFLMVSASTTHDMLLNQYFDREGSQKLGYFYFCIFFWQGVCWSLLHFCRPFMIFNGCLDSNPECCCMPQQAGALLTQPPPSLQRLGYWGKCGEWEGGRRKVDGAECRDKTFLPDSELLCVVSEDD